MLSFGLHVSKSNKIEGKYKTLLEAIENEYKDLRANTMQIFTSGPMNMKRNNMDYEAIKEYCDQNGIKIFNHGSYLSVAIWHTNSGNFIEAKPKAAINHIHEMLEDTIKLGGMGVIIHVPRHKVSTIVQTMEVLKEQKLLPNTSPYIYLEMPASKPQSADTKLDDVLTYETPEKLNYLVKTLGPRFHYKLCIDTAHQWAGGMDFSMREGWEAYINALSKNTKSHLQLIHLNGALAKNFGTGKDEHIIPLSSDDAIWGRFISEDVRIMLNEAEIQYRNNPNSLNGVNFFSKLTSNDMKLLKQSGFYAILEYAFTHGINTICEINRGLYIETKFLFDIMNGLSKQFK